MTAVRGNHKKFKSSYHENLRGLLIKVGGTISPFGLSAQPQPNGSSRLACRLDGAYKKFQGSVGLNDLASESKTALVFQILGDGKPLWKSRPVRTFKDAEDFDLVVSGIRELTLVVDCPGDNTGARTEWMEPRLSK